MIFYTAAVALVALALAPFSFSQVTGTPPPCVETCGEQAVAAAGCGSLTNATCICGDQTFLQNATVCVTTTCDASDLASALSFFQQLCGASPTNLPSGASITSGSPSTSAKQSSATASSSSKAAPQTPLSSGSVVSTATTPSSSSTTPSNSTTSSPAPSTTASNAGRLATSILALAGFTLCASFMVL